MATQSLVNMNNHVLCAIDVETSGLNPDWHEIIQVSCIPLNSNIEPMENVSFFDMKIRPNYKERIDWDVSRVTRRSYQDICDSGHPQDKVLDLFEYWFQSLDLGDRKLIPLGHNFTFDRLFLQRWMGNSHYQHFFHGFTRDTLTIIEFLNDRADIHGEQTPFAKRGLRDLCNKLDIQYLSGEAHDSLYDAMITAQVYRKLLWEFIAT